LFGANVTSKVNEDSHSTARRMNSLSTGVLYCDQLGKGLTGLSPTATTALVL
jgi:hypothetical protein